MWTAWSLEVCVFYVWMIFLKKPNVLQSFRNCCLTLSNWFCSHHIHSVFVIKSYMFQRKNAGKSLRGAVCFTSYKFWIKMWNICACSNRHFLLLHTNNKCPDVIWCWNLHWGYPMINKVVQWFHQLVYIAFSKNLFWSVNSTVFLPKLLCQNFNFMICMEAVNSSK